VSGSVLSAYQCHHHLLDEYQRQGKKIAYKNVYGKVKHLEKSGLIKKSSSNSGGRSKHGAINFKITTLGIFYIFRTKLYYHGLNMIEHNEKDGLFETFLYPHLEYKTISKITDPHLMMIVYDYLHSCCNVIDQNIDHFRSINENGIQNISIATTDTIMDPDMRDLETVGLKGFTNYLSKYFNLSWLNNDKIRTRIKKNNLNEIVVAKGGKKLTITLLSNESKASFSYLGSIIGELPIEKISGNDSNEEYLFQDHKSTTLEELLQSKNFYLHHELRKLSSNLSLEILNYSCTDYHNTAKELKAKKESLNLLKSDSSLMKLLIHTVTKINFCYDGFIN